MGKHDTQFTSPSVIATDLNADHLTVHWAKGGMSRFHYQWLRDNCRSDQRFDINTRERKALTESIPADLGAKQVEIKGSGIHIKWTDDDTDSVFDPAWLAKNAYDLPGAAHKIKPRPWGAEYTQALRSFSYQDILNDPQVAAEMIADFQRFGLVRMVDVPTEEGEVERFAEHLAYVREIAFDRVANIRVSVDPYTLGFTNAALPLHTDCSGYSWPPNVMVFHCLQNDVAGGASQYVDGAQVVAQLRDENPEALDILTTHDVEFRLWSAKADTLSQFPPVILDEAGELAILRYANWTVQPLRTVPFDVVPQWYDAWRALAARVNAPENRLSYRCEPGEILLINNHRVLHGRDAFDDGEGVRHFQQVYMELDDLAGYQRIVEGQGGVR